MYSSLLKFAGQFDLDQYSGPKENENSESTKKSEISTPQSKNEPQSDISNRNQLSNTSEEPQEAPNIIPDDPLNTKSNSSLSTPQLLTPTTSLSSQSRAHYNSNSKSMISKDSENIVDDRIQEIFNEISTSTSPPSSQISSPTHFLSQNPSSENLQVNSPPSTDSTSIVNTSPDDNKTLSTKSHHKNQRINVISELKLTPLSQSIHSLSQTIHKMDKTETDEEKNVRESEDVSNENLIVEKEDVEGDKVESDLNDLPLKMDPSFKTNSQSTETPHKKEVKDNNNNLDDQHSSTHSSPLPPEITPHTHQDHQDHQRKREEEESFRDDREIERLGSLLDQSKKREADYQRRIEGLMGVEEECVGLREQLGEKEEICEKEVENLKETHSSKLALVKRLYASEVQAHNDLKGSIHSFKKKVKEEQIKV